MRAVVVIVGLAMCLAVAYALVQVGNAPAESPAKTTADTAEGAPTTSSAAATERSEPATPTPPPSRSQVAGPEDQRADDMMTATVRVVDKETGAAVAGADVWFVVPGPIWGELTPAQQTELGRIFNDRERYCQKFGEHGISGSDGTVTWRSHEGWIEVAAREGGRFGQVAVNPAEAPIDGFVLELEPDQHFGLRVIGADGEPVAGMPVRASFQRFEPWRQRVTERSPTVGFSGEDGRLDARHIQQWSVRDVDGQRLVTLSPLILGKGAEPVVVDLDQLPSECVELRCPPMGSVLVRAVDPGGATLDCWPVLGTVNNLGETVDVYVEPQRRDDGTTLFPFVALGQSLAVQAWVGSARMRTTGVGPRNAGERTELVLRPAPDAIVLLGRAVDVNGVPIAKRGVHARVFSPDKPTGCDAETDDEGVFRLHFNESIAKAVRAELVLAQTDHGVPPDVLAANLTLSGDLPAGITQLGDVVMIETPLIAAGRLVDLSGDRIARVNAYIQRWDGKRWRRARVASTQFSDHGGFEIRGAIQPSRLRLCISDPRYVIPEPLEFALGDRNLVIELTRGGNVRATVLHDGGVTFTSVVLRLTPQATDPVADDEVKRGSLQRPVDHEAHFRWRQLKAGIYRLDLTVVGEPEPAVTLRDIVVAAGETTVDDRLTIDLRGRLRQVPVTVRDARGAPVTTRNAAVVVNSTDANSRLARFPVLDGEAVVLTSHAQVDLMVVVPGHCVERLYGVTDGARVTLRPGPRVRIELDDEARVPDGYQLAVQLEGQTRDSGAPVRTGRSSGRLFEWLHYAPPVELAAGSADMSLQVAGVYSVALTVRLSGDGPRRPVVGTEPRQIDVADIDTEQVFRIAVPAGSLQEAARGGPR